MLMRTTAPDTPPDREAGTTAAPLDLRDVLAAVRRRAWLVVLTAALATGATWLWVRQQAPWYRATAVIRIDDARRAMTGNLAATTPDQVPGRDVDPVLSLVQLLTSRAIAGAVVDSMPAFRVAVAGVPADALGGLRVAPGAPGFDSLALRFRAEGVEAALGDSTVRAAYGAPVALGGLAFTVAAPPPGATEAHVALAGRDAAVDRLLAALDVRTREHTDIVDVSAYAHDADEAQAIVNRAVRVFRVVTSDQAKEQSRVRREFVGEQLREHETLLAQAQRELARFRGATQAYSSRDRLAAEQAALAGLAVRRQELEADAALYREALGALEQGRTDAGALGALLSAPNVGTNPAIARSYQRLVTLQAARDSAVSGPLGSARTHPDVRRLDTLIAASAGDLTASVQSLVRSTEARVDAIAGMQARTAAEFRGLSGRETTEQQLVQRVESLQRLAGQLREEYQRARIEEAVAVGQVSVIDEAPRPVRPVGIGAAPRLGLAALVGLLLGGGLAVALERLNTTIRRREQVERALHVPELGVIPRAGAAPTRRLAGAAGRQALEALEAYRVLRTNLLFTPDGTPPRTIAVTSPAPGDGKSTVAANLAVAFAQQGLPVLLVDADLRRGTLHRVFEVSREPGLSDALADGAPLAHAIHATRVMNCSLLPAGRGTSSPAELLGGPGLAGLLHSLGDVYRVVLLDTAPVLAAADASIVAAGVDATVLVVRAGQTETHEARESLRQLASVGAHVAGVVLNDRDAAVERKERRYYAAYYAAPQG